MTMSYELLIDRGDLPSLAAAFLSRNLDRLVLWHEIEPDLGATRRREICERHLEVFGARRLVIADPIGTGMADLAPPPHIAQALMLLRAAGAAEQLGCTKIIWPRVIGPDFQPVGEAVDRADAVLDLVSAAGGDGVGSVIDLPLIDLTPAQVVEVAEESGAPLKLGWPCEMGDQTPCENCTECRNWLQGFEGARVEWPWALATA